MPLFAKQKKKLKSALPVDSKVKKETSPEEGSEIQGSRGMPSLFDKGITLQGQRLEFLKKGLEDGITFFNEFNNERMKLAFESFTEDMKKALYEILFFMHVNDPKFAEVKFTGIEVEHIYGITRDHEYEATANLYLENAPHGVQGIDELPELFREQFYEYIQAEFNVRPSAADVQGFCPIVSISSLGSIGTVGHKPFVSDLDLQVQYEMEPFRFDLSEWDDEQLIQALKSEISFWIQRIRVKKKISPDKLKDPNIRGELQKTARAQVHKAYPSLYRYLLANQGDYKKDLMTPKGVQLRQTLIHEMMALIKRANQRKQAATFKDREALFKQRVNTIQDYIQTKFPKAEIYMFLADNPSFRRGYHGTTLESKEASGSAYEFVLTYEVLMPGIQFTPMVPSHFVLPKDINNSQAFYERTMDYIRFGAIDIYDKYIHYLTDLGGTPALPMQYILGHGGMIYWESFKAASGNLAKALLNLFRIEMLHDQKYLIMIIEMIKDPHRLDAFVKKPEEKPGADAPKEYGLEPWELLEMEESLPLLVKDPWWLKYKVLKIAFGELSYLSVEERKRISKIIDLCFGLHIKVSEVFTKAGDTRKFDTYREKFLLDFLHRAFPDGSPQRLFLQHVNIGETKAVIEFENELKDLFKSCLDRVLEIQAEAGLPDESNQKEFEIWYHYYQKNFEPPPNMVRKSILHHLKVPRLRLQAAYKNKQWIIRSLQTESKQGKRFDTFGVLDDLPDEVDLTSSPSFSYVMADCILNSYYGYVNQGSLKEQKSVIEFDSSATYKAELIDEKYAYIRPDNVVRIANQISEFFVYRTYHYMDCVEKPREYYEIFFLLHLQRFGQLSILYRDNLTNWYLDEFEHPDLRKIAHNLQTNYPATFKSKSLIKTLRIFLRDRKIDLTNSEVSTRFWLNPNSAQTNHAANKVEAKEQALADEFKQFVYAVGKPQ
ncbi:MAG: hypothetical protein HQM14_08985 [SAR324 cluster bacterium]|nr:hypothetical protein [SAR324 cluster bacterium]